MSNPAAVRIRRAVPADLPALVALEQATFDYDRMSARQYRRHLASASARIWLAEDAAGALLGSAVVFFRRGSRGARLYSLATAAAARGQGVGRGLLEALQRDLVAHGCNRLRLEVRTDNAAATQLYERSGFRRIGHKPGYYDDGADAWRYEKMYQGDGT